jgi:hypothetical protein
MTFRACSVTVFLAMGLGLLGCNHVSGRPGSRPQVAGCHGANGNHGPAIALSNPIYLAVAGEDTCETSQLEAFVAHSCPLLQRTRGELSPISKSQCSRTG